MYKIIGFGNRLKQAVRDSSYTQKKISEIIRISEDTFSNYVKEKSFPDAKVLLELCDLLNINPTWLLTGQEHEYLNTLDSDRLTEKEKAIVEKYRSGLEPTFNTDIIRLTGEVGRLNDKEHDMILKLRELEDRDREDIYDNVDWKYERFLKKKMQTLSSSKNGGTGEEAATNETA